MNRLPLNWRFAMIASLALAAGLGSAPVARADVSTKELLSSMKGQWTAVLEGNTGCGDTSMLVTFQVDASGNGAGTATIVGHSTGCADTSTSGNDFAIHSVNANGVGTASLSCGAGCGWQFSIQVAGTGKFFILTDVDPKNPKNTPTGAAIHQL